MRTSFPARTARLLLVITAALVFMAATAFAGPITARVVSVHDGDTITVLTPDKRQIKIRFAEIDAPELSQPYGVKFQQRYQTRHGVWRKLLRSLGFWSSEHPQNSRPE